MKLSRNGCRGTTRLQGKTLFYITSLTVIHNNLQPPQALKRPAETEEQEDEQEKTRKMRRIARAKASKMARPPSPTPSVQTLDQISDEERAEILKFVETEQTQVSFLM